MKRRKREEKREEKPGWSLWTNCSSFSKREQSWLENGIAALSFKLVGRTEMTAIDWGKHIKQACIGKTQEAATLDHNAHIPSFPVTCSWSSMPESDVFSKSTKARTKLSSHRKKKAPRENSMINGEDTQTKKGWARCRKENKNGDSAYIYIYV